MSHALLAWELGANLGHIAPLRLLAQHLVARGQRVSFAVRELESAESLIDPGLGAVFQAPVRVGKGRNPVGQQVSYASLLHNCGFDDAVGLAGRIRAWRTLMLGLKCDRVYVDHAPTALLAARTLDLPRVNFGTGFTVPPVLAPYPAYEHAAAPDGMVLRRNEQTVLGVVNAALLRLKLPALDNLQQIFGGVPNLVTGYAELDHYSVARSEPRIGLPDFSHGARPVWPEPRAPRLFAYLRPSKALPRVLDALQHSRAHVLVRIADLAPAQLAQYARPNLAIVDRPVLMREVAASCDAFINYAAHGTVTEMLLAGKPGLLLPDNLERMLVARRAQGLGAALTVTAPEDADFPGLLARLIEDLRLHASAARFADRHRGGDRTGIVSVVADAAEKNSASGSV
ncbi:MAG: glycosyltransferase [Panacagrimonas sp.]